MMKADALIEMYEDTILTFASCNMKIEGTSRELNVHRNAIRSRLSTIYKLTHLDPMQFYDLVKLVEVVKEGQLCKVCRMTRS